MKMGDTDRKKDILESENIVIIMKFTLHNYSTFSQTFYLNFFFFFLQICLNTCIINGNSHCLHNWNLICTFILLYS